MANAMQTYRDAILAASITTQFIGEISQLISDIADKHQENELIKKLGEHASVGGKLDSQECKAFCVEDFVSALTKNGIPHLVIFDKLSGTPIMLTRDIDREAVLAAKSNLLIRDNRITRVSYNDFQKISAGRNVGIIRSRTPAEAKLFQQKAWETGIKGYAFKRNELEPSKLDIYFPSKMEKRAQLTMAKVTMAMMGHRGKAVRQRLEHEIEYGIKLNTRALDAKDEFYIVSKHTPDNYIKFTAEGVEHYRKGSLKSTEARTNPSFQEATKMLVSGIPGAVVVEKKDFEASEEHLKAVLAAANPYYVPSVPRDNLDKLEANAKELVDAKLIFDNSPEIPKEFFNPNTSFSTFFKAKLLDEGSQGLIKELDKLGWEEKGLVKQFMARHVEVRDQFAKKLEALERGELNTEIVVMAKGSRKSVVITSAGLECYSETAEKISARPVNDRFFRAAAMAETRHIPSAVYLNGKEEVSNHKGVLDDKAKVAGIDNERGAEIERIARMLVEKKMSLENCEPPRILSDIYNPTVSFAEYCHIDATNDKSAVEINKFIEGMEDKESILLKTYMEGCCKEIQSIEIQMAYIAEKDVPVADVAYSDPSRSERDDADDHRATIEELDDEEQELDD